MKRVKLSNGENGYTMPNGNIVVKRGYWFFQYYCLSDVLADDENENKNLSRMNGVEHTPFFNRIYNGKHLGCSPRLKHINF